MVSTSIYWDQWRRICHGIFALGEEEDRCRYALETAAKGRDVAIICSGDAGIYAMGALV